jgi:Chaperone of endosialidase
MNTQAQEYRNASSLFSLTNHTRRLSMTIAKHFALTLAVTLCALLAHAHAQTPRVSTVNVKAESDRVRISAEGDIVELRLEVVSEAGDVVFESGAITGNALDWNMRDASGERVAAGTYMATVTFRNGAGKSRKRAEQITVEEVEESSAKKTAAPQAAQATVTTSNPGVFGAIARFTGAYTIANSVITQSTTGRIGINQPTPKHTLSIGNGPSWTNNSWEGAVELPNGSAIGFKPNDGGWAFGLGHTNGGFYLFRTKSLPGTQTAEAVYDFALTDDGKVGIGLAEPISTLTVKTPPENYGLIHTNGEVEVGTWAGSSAVGTPSGWFGTRSPHPLRFFTNNTGVAMTMATNGRVGIGTTNPTRAKLHVEVSGDTGVYVKSTGAAVHGETSGISYGVYGSGTRGIGVYGDSDSHYGVSGSSLSGAGVFGSSETAAGVRGYSTSGNGVVGTSGSGNAGYFSGKVRITQGLVVEAGGCTGCNPPSDRNLKANFSSVNPRLILNKLAAIPIQSWNYKSEETTTRHIGPMAQDFRAAFNLGADDKTLNMVDAQGVTMAAIQGLYQQNQELARTVQQQSRQIERLQSQVMRLQQNAQPQRKRPSKRR